MVWGTLTLLLNHFFKIAANFLINKIQVLVPYGHRKSSNVRKCVTFISINVSFLISDFKNISPAY